MWLHWVLLTDYSVSSDYINPIDLCNRLNTYIVPEAAVHAFLTALFLINGYWIALVLNLPLLAYNAKKLALLHCGQKENADRRLEYLRINICLTRRKYSESSTSTRR